MTLVKVVKNKAYFKRFQVKFRRRREGRTDYYARKRLIWQDKNKYNTPRYRFVVRFSNKDVCCQIVYSTLVGDRVLECAYAHELPGFGLKFGLTNYAAAYCTGLLLARRTLKKLEMDKIYPGEGQDGKEVSGEIVPFEENEERRPFTCVLDVGLRRTTTGSNLFGALKGAVDGGLDIPHSNKRFYGYSAGDADGDKDGSHDAEAHKHRIYGGHVADYMRVLQDEDEEDGAPAGGSKEVKPFSKMEALGIAPDDVMAVYKKVHAAIYANPDRKEHAEKKKTEDGPKKRWNRTKSTLQERKHTVLQKKEAFRQKLAREAEED